MFASTVNMFIAVMELQKHAIWKKNTHFHYVKLNPYFKLSHGMFSNHIDTHVLYNPDNYVWYLELLKSYSEVSYDLCMCECKHVHD